MTVHATLIALVIAPALSGFEGPALISAQDSLGTYEDRIAVEDVMARYVWAVAALLGCRHRSGGPQRSFIPAERPPANLSP